MIVHERERSWYEINVTEAHQMTDDAGNSPISQIKNFSTCDNID